MPYHDKPLGNSEASALESLRGCFSTSKEHRRNQLIAGLLQLAITGGLYCFVFLQEISAERWFFVLVITVIFLGIAYAGFFFWNSIPRRSEFDDYRIRYFRNDREVWSLLRSTIVSMQRRGDKIVLKTQTSSRRIPIQDEIEAALESYATEQNAEADTRF